MRIELYTDSLGCIYIFIYQTLRRILQFFMRTVNIYNIWYYILINKYYRMSLNNLTREMKKIIK